MFENIENLKIISCLSKSSNSFGKVISRSSNTFNIRVSGSVLYDFYDRQITVNVGEMIFIPKGSRYTHKIVSEGESLFISINFEGDFKDATPKLYSIKDFVDGDYICSHLADLWKFGSSADRYKCTSLFYNLLAFVSETEHLEYKSKSKFSVINPALDYLKIHLYDPSLKVDKLSVLCGISDTYFRKIFISRFKTNPQNYITSKRLSHAKSILDSGDFDTVTEVALSVGYSDPLYFGKVFKKFYGVSPGNMNK